MEQEQDSTTVHGFYLKLCEVNGLEEVILPDDLVVEVLATLEKEERIYVLRFDGELKTYIRVASPDDPRTYIKPEKISDDINTAIKRLIKMERKPVCVTGEIADDFAEILILAGQGYICIYHPGCHNWEEHFEFRLPECKFPVVF